MKNYTLVSVFVLTGLLNFIAAGRTDTQKPSPASPTDEKSAKSLAAFQQVLTALTHQRCMNCHPTDDRPRQGDDRHVHLFDVQRGPDNQGLAVMRCNACQQSENEGLTKRALSQWLTLIIYRPMIEATLIPHLS